LAEEVLGYLCVCRLGLEYVEVLKQTWPAWPSAADQKQIHSKALRPLLLQGQFKYRFHPDPLHRLAW
jgi:hypothetical protein